VDAHSFAVVVSEKKLIPDLYRKIGKDTIVYYANMDMEKRIKVIGLIESGSARKAIITSNTDGLPTHIKGDIFFYDFPLSIYEIVDLLRRKSVVNLCYSSSDIEKRRYELNKLFPDREKLKEIAITATNLKDKEKLEKILESEYELNSTTLRKIYLDLLEEFGFDFDKWSFSKDEKVPWRLLERELEIAQFEETVSVLSKDLKWIFNFFKNTVIK
jgi:single-stranded-DNA-specific exonuclease